MDRIELIKEHLNREKEFLLKALQAAKETRDSAPAATESHSDTTRSQYEKLVIALEEKVRSIDDFSSILPKNLESKKTGPISLWSYVEISLNKNIIKLILVPEGMGGKELEGIKLISDNSPLGSLLIGKKLGEKFEFNEQRGKVLKIE